MKVLALTLLLTLILAPQEPPCAAAFRIPRPPIPDPAPIAPDLPPVPGVKPNPHIVPDPVIPAANPPDGQYPLGRFTDNNRAPFEDLTQGDWDQFFSKVDDILEAAPTAKVDEDGNPNGYPGDGGVGTIGGTNGPSHTPTISAITVSRDPAAEPTNACKAWSSLSVYCGGGGTDCACYSGSYYVPDQWNSLAAACAIAVVSGYSSPLTTTSTSDSTSTTSVRPVQLPTNIITIPTLFPIQTFPSFIPPPTIPPAPPAPPRLPPRQQQAFTTTTPLRIREEEEEEETSSDDSVWLGALVSRASSYADYCPTNTATVAFGEITPTTNSGNSAARAINIAKTEIIIISVFMILFV